MTAENVVSEWKHELAFSRHHVPELCGSSALEIERAQGMPGEGLTHGPPANKKAGGSYHRISRIIRHSLRDGVRLIARSPRGPGFLAPVIARLVTTQLDLSVGRPGPRAFASTSVSFVCAEALRHHRGHRITLSTFVTIAKRPSV